MHAKLAEFNFNNKLSVVFTCPIDAQLNNMLFFAMFNIHLRRSITYIPGGIMTVCCVGESWVQGYIWCNFTICIFS